MHEIITRGILSSVVITRVILPLCEYHYSCFECETFVSSLPDETPDVLERAMDEEEAKSGRQSLASPSLHTFTQFVKTYAHVTTYVLVCVSKYKPSEYDKIANAFG